jgi:hypothetical protein
MSSRTQCDRILRLLVEARSSWVPLPEIMACAAQYNARVLELRRLGFNIENRTERIDGHRHSWFRLVSSPAPPAKPESDYMCRVREDEDRAAPLFAGVRQ